MKTSAQNLQHIIRYRNLPFFESMEDRIVNLKRATGVVFYALFIYLLTVAFSAIGQTSNTANAGFKKMNFADIGTNSLVSFTVKKIKENVYINWKAVGEKEHGVFIVEHSNNGVDFSPIGTKNGVGTELNLPLGYSHTHSMQQNLTAWYRITKVYNDGSYYVSNPVMIENTLEDESEFANASARVE